MAKREYDFTKAEIKAGIFVLVSLLIFGGFVAVVMGYRTIKETKRFYIYFEDTGGLNLGADVRFGGIRVGRVVGIQPAPEDQSRIQAIAEVSATTPVNAQSYAYISQTTLTSEKHLEITTGGVDSAQLESGSEIPGGTGGLFGSLDKLAGKAVGLIDSVSGMMSEDDGAVGEGFGNIFESLGGVLSDFRILLGVIDSNGNVIMTEEEQKTVAEIFANLDSAVQDVRDVVDENREGLGAAVDKFVEIEDDAQKLVSDLDSLIADNRPAIDEAIASLNDILDTVETAVDGVAEELDSVVAKLQTTLDNATGLTGDARMLLDDNSPALEEIIQDTREAVRYLKEFARVMAEQPQSVLRGRTPTGRK